ncbi:protein jagged-1-like isoform X2 [Liolophura sinensis]|uniref:protein jagged-1-like isoform X2 n=1 Tax=Liolophura sinensis TaxID=3198878 RepID=UPI003158E1D0
MDQNDSLIGTVTKSAIILPSEEWQTIGPVGQGTSLVFRIRVVCDNHYYNTTCTQFCRPRNDPIGHYSCNSMGEKVCMKGYIGEHCERASCKPGCHETHGSCNKPGECRCSFGWTGPLCDQCIKHPGCAHGRCMGSPWTCYCELNWGGILCDKDLNYCRHTPCANNGICQNIAPNKYACSCPPGYSGPNCEIAKHACSGTSNPCHNEGTCIEVSGDFVCHCKPGWTGRTCSDSINECESNPCQHGGSCLDKVNGYTCQCTPGWQGPHCQLDADECHGSPCVNAYACQNLVGGYLCKCQAGWTGKLCDINVNDCSGQCQHGSTCVDLVSGYMCACLPGYTGKDCETNIDECSSNPCQNGGQCHDIVAGYQCICHYGYTGQNCEIDVDRCNPNPCMMGSTCFNLPGDYFCHCRKGYAGKNCSQSKPLCQTETCQDIDSCLTFVGANETDGRFVSSKVCGQHGTCISEPGSRYHCSCDAGYTGSHCHDNINDCASEPCHNQGTCIDKVSSFQCLCTEGWEGPVCNINHDDCITKPCRNGGVCTDLVGDFRCQCKDDWKGKTCSLRTSNCDGGTCANNGRCMDQGNTFICHCASGWTGTTCQTRTNTSCHSDPCVNGGTCVNRGDNFACVCKEGFEGETCEIDVNNCNPYPCYNGGRCIDEVNWYRCECAPGFAGPECRININECFSNPCAYGSTCIDGIGDYRCVCPPGRNGRNCGTVIGQTSAPKQCSFNRRLFPENSTWQHGCNSCSCSNGQVTCSKVWCGPKNCLYHPNQTEPVFSCGEQETCVIQTEQTCFTPPCLPWGQCRPMNRVTDPTPAGVQTTCIPNSAKLSNNCAKITLIFDKSKMPAGVTVETVCRSLRQLPDIQRLARDRALIILCDVQDGHVNSLEVTVSVDSHSSSSSEEMVKTAVGELADAISHKASNSTALAAVMEVRVETTYINQPNSSDSSYLVPLICSLIGLIGLLAIILTILMHNRQRRKCRARRMEAEYTQQKTNNQNEENLRRYKNPLFETDKGGGTSSPNDVRDSVEFFDIDLQKYEKSPQRTNVERTELSNDWTERSLPTKSVRKKDINIEISRTLTAAASFSSLSSEGEMIV